MHSQIRRTYAYALLAYCGITQLWVIYLAQRGLSLVEVGLCESIFHVASFLFEVPSGVLADRFTYKQMLTFSRVAAMLSAVIMLAGGSFWWFAASFVVSAWSYNLQSGTLEALVYESLQDAKRGDDYPQITSRLNAFIEVAATGGLLVAGTLTHGHLAAAYWIAIALAIGAIVTVAGLKEPAMHQARERPETIGSITRAAGSALRHDPKLLGLMLCDALLMAVATGYYYYFQNVMQTRHFPGWLITASLAASAVVAVLAIRLAPHLLHFNARKLLVSISAALGVSLLLAGLANSTMLIVVYLLSYALSALLEPVFNVYYNARIPSAQRATLLSVASLLFSLAMIGLFPLLGWCIGAFGFAATFAVLGGVLISGTLLVSIVIHKWTTR